MGYSYRRTNLIYMKKLDRFLMYTDLKCFYKEKIIPLLLESFVYTNVEKIPKVVKVSVNRGLGEDSKNSKELENSLRELAMVTGQYPVVNTARKSVAGFKIRAGMTVGCSSTLRGEPMYNFLLKLRNIILPRIRDFRGINPKSFDGKGNYTL